MSRIKSKKCRHCGELFQPDARNANRQQYCGKPECRKASKAASQKRWLQKPENRNYFRGPDNVKRVQEWRKANPGYWRRPAPAAPNALQDSLNAKPIENISNMASLSDGPSDALQDVLNAQQAVLIGLIANLTGYALQDHIAMTIRRMQQTGIDILNGLTHNQGDGYDSKISHLSQPYPHHPPTVQLGGSPSGARLLY